MQSIIANKHHDHTSDDHDYLRRGGESNRLSNSPETVNTPEYIIVDSDSGSETRRHTEVEKDLAEGSGNSNIWDGLRKSARLRRRAAPCNYLTNAADTFLIRVHISVADVRTSLSPEAIIRAARIAHRGVAGDSTDGGLTHSTTKVGQGISHEGRAGPTPLKQSAHSEHPIQPSKKHSRPRDDSNSESDSDDPEHRRRLEDYVRHIYGSPRPWPANPGLSNTVKTPEAQQQHTVTGRVGASPQDDTGQDW